MIKHAVWCFLLIFMLILPVCADTMSHEDHYIMGYINGILLRTYDITVPVEVRSGIVYVPESLAANVRYEEIYEDILNTDGVKKIRVVNDEDLEMVSRIWVLPDDPLFRPLIADLKWPRFSAGYHYYTESANYRHAFDAVFGKSFSLIRKQPSISTFAEVGMQAAVYATFDLDTPSFDLINADYMFGVPFTIKWHDLTVLTRIYHQSSHLGDEFVKSNPDVERVNLSFEKWDVIASYMPQEWLRVYGGGGVLIHKDPQDLDRLSYQLGFEFYNLSDSLFRPITGIAVDVQGFQETGYTPNYSVKLGIALAKKSGITLDFYSGNSPHGQFYVDRVTWFGASLVFYI